MSAKGGGDGKHSEQDQRKCRRLVEEFIHEKKLLNLIISQYSQNFL